MQNASVYNRMTNAEKEVAKVLKDFGIKWSYEHPIFVWDENKRPRVWTPDFYLASFGIYIEVCGSESFDYDYRKTVYAKNGFDVIFLHLYKQTNKWKNHLMNYIEIITDYRYHKLNEILRKEN